MGAKRGVGGHTAAISHRSDEGPQTVKSCNNTYSTLPETIMEVENPQSVEATVDENTLPRGPFPCLWGRSISSNRKTVHRKPLVRRDGRTEGSPAKRRRQKSVFWFLVAMPLAASLAPSSFLFLVAMLELVFRLRVQTNKGWRKEKRLKSRPVWYCVVQTCADPDCGSKLKEMGCATAGCKDGSSLNYTIET